MLSGIELQHFKCFERLHLPLKPLTLLSGLNGSGKSTVLQALVLLRQTMRGHEWSTRLMLNGSDIRLGTVSDVIDKIHGRQTLEIGLMDDGLTCHWIFKGDRSDMSMLVDSIAVNGSLSQHPERLRYLFPDNNTHQAGSLADRIRSLTYITAERLGPREVYSLEDSQIALVVGSAGEHAASVLHWRRDQAVLTALTLTTAPETLLRQVEERMRTFFPGFGMEVQQIPQANAITMGLRMSDDTDFHRPVHAGFGLTQIFPIIVAALSSKEGDILLIENPEVHLHPAGQAKMGEFLAQVARSGVQVIVESHSDHILNGIRRSVKAETLTPENVILHFFRSRSMDGPQVISPQITRNGSVDSWPQGFFDQFDKDMSYFAGWEV